MVVRTRAVVFTSLISLCTVQPVFASYSDMNKANHTGPRYITISLSENCCSFIYNSVLTISDGPVLTSKAGNAENLPPANGSNYQYTPDGNTQTVNIFGFFLGGQFQTSDSFEWQLGVSYYQPTNFSVTGTTLQGADPASSNTYRYSYNISSQVYMAETKLLLNMGDYDEYHPYVSLGMGVARNQSGSYTIQDPAFLTFSPIFASQTVTSFTYMAGLGLDMDFAKNWRIGVGYRFADLGKSNLGSAVIDTTPIAGTISQPHLYLNEFLAQLSFLF